MPQVNEKRERHHRFVVDVTFEEPVSEFWAKELVQDRLRGQRRFTYGTRITGSAVLRYNRVIASIRRKFNEEATA